MIISRTPLRISLGGGGTDLPSYYRNNGHGFLIAAAITRHVYIAVNDNFDREFLLKYSSVEKTTDISSIQHPLLRECLRSFNLKGAIEISSMADIPAGTGLGSSGSFTVGVLKALAHHQHRSLTNEQIAAEACTIEIERLGEGVGKQDQYIAATGGISGFTFRDNESVEIERLDISRTVRQRLEEDLLLFYTGVRRSAGEVLRSESDSTGAVARMRSNLNDTREIGYATRDMLCQGDIDAFGRLLTQQWQLKFARQRSELHEEIDDIITAGIRHGAVGGKLVGAGGGGFILFFADQKVRLREEMTHRNLMEVPFGIDYEGSSIIVAN
ncbi:MAG: galactokinase [Phycisphaerae bacterium]|nr:galactokinase [Phycisphaerae bacterium]